MSVRRRITEYLGLVTPPPVPGFTRSDYGPRLPVCETCGALVAFEARELHLAWHRGRPHAG